MNSKSLFWVLVIVLFFLTLAELNGQVVWQRHPQNPVIPTWSGNYNDPGIYRYTLQPSVMYDPSTKMFKCWFTSKTYQLDPWTPTLFCVSHAFSPDGMVWYSYFRNPVLEPGPSSFDYTHVSAPRVLWVSPYYRMYYTGNDGTRYRIGMATSVDGIVWTKSPSNPILSPGAPGAWDGQSVANCKVYYDGQTYMMWYEGYVDASASEVGLATSTDGVNWTKHPSNPVLRKGLAGQWDGYAVQPGDVVKISGRFYVLYVGRAFDTDSRKVGLATSINGIDWVKYEMNPVLVPGPLA